MTQATLRIAGLFFILGAILINIPYTLLIMNFEYPDILTEAPSYILSEFAEGGAYGQQDALVWTWFAFTWTGFPILLGLILLGRYLEQAYPQLAAWTQIGTVLGILGMLTQVMGLARWVFVVPHLANLYVDPQASEATRASAEAAFIVIHRYGGNVIGEHLGQFFTVGWMFITSLVMWRSKLFPKPIALLGVLASGVYLLGQTELLSLVTDLPVVPESGFVGSLLWLAWLIAVGAWMLRGRLALSPAA